MINGNQRLKEIKLKFAKERYSAWRRQKRKEERRGMMILIKEDMVVEEREYGDEMVETSECCDPRAMSCLVTDKGLHFLFFIYLVK